jgi:hypothetical protein
MRRKESAQEIARRDAIILKVTTALPEVGCLLVQIPIVADVADVALDSRNWMYTGSSASKPP